MNRIYPVKITPKFLDWLRQQALYQIYSNVDIDRMKTVTDKMKDHPVFNDKSRDLFDAVEFFYQVTESIKVKERFGTVYFYVDIFAREHNTKLPLNTLVKLMSYGCLTFKGYPLFTDTFHNITTNINEYYNKYISLHM